MNFMEFAKYKTRSNFPTIGNVQRLYLSMDDNKLYHWSYGEYHIVSADMEIDYPELPDVPYEPKPSELLVETTYANLVTLRDTSKLIPGAFYRITDYVTTTVQENTQSAEHPFDIIVTADDVNKLNENARAFLHEGDTYFANSKLEAWKLNYCLDNDTSRFAWADEVDGKGVIYRMIDEFNNDVPYDFKNIQFKRYDLKGQTLIEGQYYSPDLDGMKNAYQASMNKSVFHILQISCGKIFDEDAETVDDYLDGSGYTHEDGTFASIDDPDFGGDPGLFVLLDVNNYYWVYTFNEQLTNVSTMAIDSSLLKANDISNNFIEFNTRLANNVFVGTWCISNTFEHSCSSNTFGNDCHSNSFGSDCSGNTFGNGCHSNSFGSDCSGNTFGNGCYYNTFGNGCYYNTFGSNCSSNTFGDNYFNNTFGNSCSYNAFGNLCSVNTFGDNCFNNTFGNNCYSNTFGYRCNYNTFGNGCQYLQISDPSLGVVHEYIYVENGTQGASDANKLDLYDPAMAGKSYQVTFKRTPSDKYLMLWATDNGTMTGKVKDDNLDTTWEDIV